MRYSMCTFIFIAFIMFFTTVRCQTCQNMGVTVFLDNSKSLLPYFLDAINYGVVGKISAMFPMYIAPGQSNSTFINYNCNEFSVPVLSFFVSYTAGVNGKSCSFLYTGVQGDSNASMTDNTNCDVVVTGFNSTLVHVVFE